MIGIVLVSHSAALADGLAEMADQIAGGEVRIVAAGGGPEGTLGTDAATSSSTPSREADTGNGVLVLADLGSAILSVKAALASGDVDGTRALLADAPLVEGAIAAAVAASIGQRPGGGARRGRGGLECPQALTARSAAPSSSRSASICTPGPRAQLVRAAARTGRSRRTCARTAARPTRRAFSRCSRSARRAARTIVVEASGEAVGPAVDAIAALLASLA